MSGCVFDVARFSMVDGPGIRTVVFLKGCPLHCRWCHNPESQSAKAELLLVESKCVGCGNCIAVCPNGCFSDAGYKRTLCQSCGECANRCFSGARTIAGGEMSVDEVMAIAVKDQDYYRENGGLTISGGEPLLQPEFTKALLAQAKAKGWQTAIESCGYAPWSVIEELLPVTDLWLYDIKCIDDKRHNEFTGVSNRLILENLYKLDSCGAKIELRCPLIPNLNDSDDDLKAILDIASKLKNIVKIKAEPYHPFGLDKLKQLGRPAQKAELVPTNEDVERYNKVLKREGEFRHEKKNH